jgi:hypothetical protein
MVHSCHILLLLFASLWIQGDANTLSNYIMNFHVFFSFLIWFHVQIVPSIGFLLAIHAIRTLTRHRIESPWYHSNRPIRTYFKYKNFLLIFKDKCFNLLSKQRYMRKPYIVSIESDEEMSFIYSLMISTGASQIYVGANNIIKKSLFCFKS